jgi:hypothetical protein
VRHRPLATPLAPLFAVLAACSSSPEAPPADEAGQDGGKTVEEPIDGTGDGQDGGVPLVDPATECVNAQALCPTMPAAEGGGLVSIDRCNFGIVEAQSFTTLPDVVAALEARATTSTIAAVLADLNRTATPVAAASVPGAPPGVEIAFRWNTEDQETSAWYPQGITGSADANDDGLVEGKRVLLVSWYNGTKGVRLAFVDVTDPKAPKYRYALLVEPTGSGKTADFAPVKIHAGGIAWVGNLLYVADTSRGLRVFDTAHVMQVATDVDEIGCASGTCRGGLYKYVIPQVGAYDSESYCDPLFSFVALDRSTTPPSLVSGEYCSGSACSDALAGRVLRWPLTQTTKLATGKSWASEAWLMGQRQVQGAVSRQGLFFLSSSKPAGTGGEIYRTVKGKSATSPWIDAPEDLMVDEKNGLLWSLSEGVDARVVMAAKLATYPAP